MGARLERITSDEYGDIFSYLTGGEDSISVYVTPTQDEFKAGLKHSGCVGRAMTAKEAEDAQNAVPGATMDFKYFDRDVIVMGLRRNGFELQKK